ncbi:TonB-dependent receptor family protein [Sphingomonas turrisvirgatae]|uniref:TonB-dependent receptor n=1 Tax=Sphingomonas turrisvirgatae TaxID=1888892 RepID=A0A1E3LTS4_9SPHN|nr:TonB-dependent receptor [Sphingomonas turrisvirgatae]ODP37143.1 TonB-dependent receptor [Sphingomonas turrisvirgatae]
MNRLHAAALLAAICLASPAAADEQRDPPIIVTGHPDADDPPVVAEARERLARTPGAVAVVAAETFEDRLPIGLPDVLRDVPGVLSNKRYGEESRLSIRGSGIGQGFHQRGVLLAENGISFADADGFSDFQKIDVLSARMIEVYKGGNALRFGGAQLGGAVNFVTISGRTAPSTVLLRADGGSYDSWRGQAAAGGVLGDVDLYGSINGYKADGFRERSYSEQLRGTVNLGYRIGRDSEVRLIATAATIDQGVPGTLTLAEARANPRPASVAARTGRWSRDQEVRRVTLQTRLRLSEGLVFEGGVYATETDLRHPIPIVIEQDIHTQGAFGRFDLSGELAGHKADLFVGASYRTGAVDQQTYANLAGRNGMKLGDALQQATGLDLFAEGRFFVVPQLALVAGASWGHASRDYANRLLGRGDGIDFEWLAPRFGLLWERGAAQVYANVTRSVEPPAFGALAQAGYSGFAFVPVDPQRAWTVELGTRGRSGAVTWDVAAYRAAIDGEMLNFVVAPNIPAAVFNADRTLHQGVEASVDWRIARGLRLRQGWTWSDFRFVDDPIYGNNRLPVVPQHQLRTSLHIERGGAWIEPMLDWRPGSVWVDHANTLKAPGYALVHLSAGIDLPGGVSLFADARNLTDTNHVPEFGAVANAGGVDQAVYYPGEGRSLFGGVRVRF